MLQVKTFRPGFLAISTMCGLVFAACRPAASIRSYSVPKEPSKVAQAPALEPTDRMLAAIVPAGEKAWFFKVTGPLKPINSVAPEIDKFLEGIEVASDGEQPDWTLPAGWEEQPGSGMRAATISIPTTDVPLELSVLSLPWTGSPQDGVLANVNRWRRQMGLSAIGPQEMSECTSELQLGDVVATRVDLRGWRKEASMKAPFSAGAKARSLPPSKVPSTPSAGRVSGAPEMEPPEEWQPGRLNSFRKAAFVVKGPGQQAEITVMDFPASGGSAMSDPLTNLNRWRDELGMQALAEEDLPGQFEAIELGGTKGNFAALFPENDAGQATLVAMAERDGLIWFFKMKGDRDLVATQQGKFREFLKSVRFDPALESANSGGSDDHQ
ncbi:MAG: hypothetical protein MK161_11880 [Pirellulales bacterium]|nr:hypothetical protein [Pirellulales bacterium]